MAKLSYTALLLCTLALVQIVNASYTTSSPAACDKELPSNCCDGKEGSTTAPAAWPASQSPAGGPVANPEAVVCVLYRTSNCLICRKSDKISECCVAATNETDDTKFGGPTPLNEYLIGKRYFHPKKNTDWYNLYPRHEDPSTRTYYGYRKRTKTGRAGLALHRGTNSLGCVTVTPTDDDGCWAETKAVLDMGDMTYNSSNYSGFLYVLDE